jgi:hypothetical protein
MIGKNQYALPMELPLPISFYTGLDIASRSTLWRWQQAGLTVLKEGNRVYVTPEDMKAFLQRNTENTQPNKLGGRNEHR